jgi:hypothetical protein
LQQRLRRLHVSGCAVVTGTTISVANKTKKACDNPAEKTANAQEEQEIIMLSVIALLSFDSLQPCATNISNDICNLSMSVFLNS